MKREPLPGRGIMATVRTVTRAYKRVAWGVGTPTDFRRGAAGSAHRRNVRMGQVVLLLEEGRDLKGLLRTRLYTAETEQKTLASNPKS